MIPDFDLDGNLPPGIYWTTWQEFTERFGSTPHRQRLLQGLKMALEVLKIAGCSTVYIGGSFVTTKKIPSDYDGCWDSKGIDIELLNAIDPVLLDFSKGRAAQKTKYLGELFVSDLSEGIAGNTFKEFFQHDKETGNRKGIITLDLRRF